MFKINDISSPTKLSLSGINFRDLNKRFGKKEDYIELQILNLNNEVLSIFNLNKTLNEIVDGLSLLHVKAPYKNIKYLQMNY